MKPLSDMMYHCLTTMYNGGFYNEQEQSAWMSSFFTGYKPRTIAALVSRGLVRCGYINHYESGKNPHREVYQLTDKGLQWARTGNHEPDPNKA